MNAREVAPAIVPVMIGTAGHVDHGKTSLVKLLTGCDTDRLREEKARGLTIDLGFAPCRFAGNRLAGIVDVPGHEDFVRNMVAGAASIDILMLVVAADDGMMPQTIEHLRIVSLLRTPKVMAAVTKVDLVDQEMVELVCEEVADFLARAGFPGAPIVPVSNTTFAGINEVRQTLQEMVGAVETQPDPRSFRMHVERVFTVKGYGTVVTGVPVSGRCRAGDGLTLLPGGEDYPVRAIQSYKLDTEEALAGACAAINLRDLNAEAAKRGMTLSAPGVYEAATEAVVHVRNVADGVKLKRLQPAFFHSGTFSCQARMKLIDADELPPLGEAFAHLKLEHPHCLAAGDRYVLRTLSPVDTVAGGVVLAVGVKRIRHSEPGLRQRLQDALSACQGGNYFAATALAGSSIILGREEALKLTHSVGDEASRHLAVAEASGLLLPLGGTGWVVAARTEQLRGGMLKDLARYHAAHPYAWGMEPKLVCRRFGLGTEAFKPLSRILCDDGGIVVRHGRLALKDYAPALSQKQMDWREAILERVESGGIQAPARGNLMKDLGIPAAEMKRLTRLLAEEGRLRQVGVNLVAADVLDECERIVRALFEKIDVVDLPRFREATGASRNLAVALLDRFDAEGMTKRIDEGRILVENGSDEGNQEPTP